MIFMIIYKFGKTGSRLSSVDSQANKAAKKTLDRFLFLGIRFRGKFIGDLIVFYSNRSTHEVVIFPICRTFIAQKSLVWSYSDLLFPWLDSVF